MSYDEGLAERIRDVVADRQGVIEKKMFGGVAFLLEGRMFCGIVKEDLMVRVGPVDHAAALGEAHTRPMDFNGKPMVGYIYVAPPGLESDLGLRRWVEQGAAFVATMGPKGQTATRATAKKGKVAIKKPTAKKETAKKAPSKVKGR